MTRSQSRTVGFCDQYVRVNTDGLQAEHLLDFLCCDLQECMDAQPRATYDLAITDQKPMLSLRQGTTELYQGTCRFELAYALINEIIHECITANKSGLALHAAAIGLKAGAVLLPGTSGSGKTTLTTWLVAHGCNYLTDELVLLSGKNHCIHPLTRPFSLKTGSAAVLSTFLNFTRDDGIAGVNGFMLPHRLVNENFSTQTPSLALILFPEFKKGAVNTITKLTAAVGCAKLMGCYVNARNLHNHGISQLAEVSRNTPIYQLTYGSFTGLKEQLTESFPTLFPWQSG